MSVNLETVKFKELYKVPSRNGLTKPKRVRGEGYKFVNMKEIFAFDRMKNIPAEYAPLSSKEKISSSLESLDLLFARQSLVLSGAGKCSIFLGDDELTSFESHLIRVRLDKERVNPEYYFYYFKSHQGRGLIYSIVEQGAGQSGIRGSDLAELNVPDVNIVTQNNVADTLRLFDDKIDLNSRMNATLEAMAQAIFKDWFVDFGPTQRKADGETDPVKILGGLIPDPAKAAPIATLFPDSFNDEGLPQGWDSATLNDYANLNARSWKKTNHPDRVRYLDLKNTKWGIIEEFTEYLWSEAPSRARRIASPNDTLVGTVRPGNGSYTFISEDGYTASTGFAVLTPKETKFTNFVYIAATRKDSIDDLAHKADGGAYPAVRPDVVAAIEVVKANEIVLEAFENIVSPMRMKIEQSKKENQTLAETRDYLLPKLMSGEVRVGDVAGEASNVVGLDIDLFGRKHLPADQSAERDAVMVAAIIDLFDSDGYVVGNFRYQKGVYFLKRYLDLPQATTTKQAAGPYDATLRYEGGHKIAQDRRYIREAFINGKTGNKLGSKITDAKALVNKFGLAEGLKWVENNLRFKSNDELECLATVDFAMNELRARGSAITVDTIIQDINRDDVWRPKLTKAHFRRDKIRDAITELNKFFGGM